MKKFLLTLVLLVSLVGIARAEIVFEDDFESYSDGSTPGWYNPKGDVTVTVDDGTVFESENQYVNMTNPGGDRTVLREWINLNADIPTLSLDINEPDSSTGRFVIKLTSGGATWLRTPSVNLIFDNGVVSPAAGSQSAAYTLDAPHHVDIVTNFTEASKTYYGNTLQSKCYDVWIDYQLVFGNVPFHDAAAYRILGLALEIPDADVGTINLDNVQLRDEAYLPANPLAAGNPVPESMETGVALDAALFWDAGIDITTGSYANVSEYKVNIGYPVTDTSRLTDPNFLSDPNLTVTSYTVAESGSNGGSTPPLDFLERDITYAWRVDEVLADANSTVVTGANWAFTTVLSVPVINADLPADTAVGLGEYAELAVDATNPFTQDATGLSYQWMYSPDGVTYSPVGADSPIYALAAAQPADQGYYYCDVTIDSNGETVSSRTAFLIVKQALAHWTMDQADFVAGQYLDIAGTHNAAPSETPVFVAGAGPDMPEAGAAVIDPNSYDANIGTWNPLETTGQITISIWLKWNGDTTNISGGYEILSKSSGWDLDLSMWNLKLRSVSGGNAGIWFYNKSNSLIRTAGLIPADTWTHVCATYGSSVARLYIDGELVVEKTGAVMGTGTDSTLKFGGTSASNAFPGAWDEVMILNYLASEEDAAALYYQTSREAVCLNPPALDFNSDCQTDILDFAILAENWLACGKVPAEACGQ